jgi:hypothetical protein
MSPRARNIQGEVVAHLPRGKSRPISIWSRSLSLTPTEAENRGGYSRQKRRTANGRAKGAQTQRAGHSEGGSSAPPSREYPLQDERKWHPVLTTTLIAGYLTSAMEH